jgi:TonB family protein
MSRLEKKCFIVSATLHGLLFGVVVFGSAFLVPSEKIAPVTPIKVYDASMVTDALNSTGGNPNVMVAPAPVPQIEQPQPTPPRIPQPTPPKPQPPKVERVEPPEPVKPVRHHEILPEKDLKPVTKIDKIKPAPKLDPTMFKPVVRKASDKKVKPPKEQDETADREFKAMAAARKKAAAEFKNSLTSLSKNMSASTLVDVTYGPGGGPVSANYRDLVFSRYYSAWSPPVDTDDTREVPVSITISRDGNILSARILKRSGNIPLDNSIQNALENVTFIAPFPAGASEPERVFKIIFTLEAKRAIG